MKVCVKNWPVPLKKSLFFVTLKWNGLLTRENNIIGYSLEPDIII